MINNSSSLSLNFYLALLRGEGFKITDQNKCARLREGHMTRIPIVQLQQCTDAKSTRVGLNSNSEGGMGGPDDSSGDQCDSQMRHIKSCVSVSFCDVIP
jgi:hypothetical protein